MNPMLRRITTFVWLVPLLAYVELVVLHLVFALVLEPTNPNLKGLFTDVLSLPTEVLVTVGALALAQGVSLLVPLPSQPSRGPSAPLLGRALLAAFIITVAFAVPIIALLDMPTWLAPEGAKLEGIGEETVHALLVVWALSWLFFTALLTHRGGAEPDALERAVTRATTGTAVGLALATPWYLVLRRKQQCFCALGTFYALILGIWSLLVLGGPFLLLARRERRRRTEAEGAPSV